jgi:lipid-A-disaccharide synthase
MAVPTRDSPSIVFIAGDISGDMHASHLLNRLKADWALRHPEAPPIRFAAAGSEHLRSAGADIWEDTTTWGALGLVEGLKRLPTLLAAKRRLISRIRKEKPDLVIPVDFRAFNMSLLKDIRYRPDGSKQKAVYYIAPVLWSSPKDGKTRSALSAAVDAAGKLPGKAGKGARDRFEALAELVDLALVAYPFSLDAYERAGVNYRYIGHPLGPIALDEARKRKYLSRYGAEIGDSGRRIIGVAPGSRIHELKYHMPVIRELLERLLMRYPNLWVFCPVPSEKFERMLRKMFGEVGDKIHFVPDDCYDLMESSDLLIFKSGTSVQLALLLAVPVVTFYKLASRWMVALGKKLFQNLPYYAFPNLLAGREIVPEFVQERFTLPNIYVACTELLDDPAKAGHMRAELAEVRKLTMKPDPVGEASAAILNLLD